ncbi:hypothetical protein FZEAL_4458 [Fusarium zealandicum]|uniref:Nuclear membrane fusion protein Kar5 n=1 Tax=Fusarium zealandicum TaxID=1053134 RepID=A0A8H4XLJ8_9HYPO|nr:hypothetical protein FZEAL_4458 [Fusarium zealandicum]
MIQPDFKDAAKDLQDFAFGVVDIGYLFKASARILMAVYSAAIQELHDLESEPLCHRIAARLLVNNCHLLNGQDEATVHIDSGRATRDFVDSYAASLAICDLERGSFVIPSTCSKFRETTLSALPIPAVPQLHVSTLEIDNCLEGLAQSDSAWNTWISYRHKALRFCEAARADHEKDENLHLYQRVTKILERLTHQIETEMEERLQSLSQTFQAASHLVENLGPQVHQLRTELDLAGDVLRERLAQVAKDSGDTIRDGLEDARSLHQLLALLIRETKENAAAVASSQEIALQTVTQRANSEIDVFMTALTAAVASSVSIQGQLDLTETRALGILEKQAKIEEGMEKLDGLADNLLVKYDSHEWRLDQAQRRTGQILEILDATAVSAAGFQNYVFGGFGLAGLWPYIVFPALSLTMGSYGLQPSLWRNLWLVGLGEIAGFTVSNLKNFIDLFLSSHTIPSPASTFNETLVNDRLPDHFISMI